MARPTRRTLLFILAVASVPVILVALALGVSVFVQPTSNGIAQCEYVEGASAERGFVKTAGGDCEAAVATMTAYFKLIDEEGCEATGPSCVRSVGRARCSVEPEEEFEKTGVAARCTHGAANVTAGTR